MTGSSGSDAHPEPSRTASGIAFQHLGSPDPQAPSVVLIHAGIADSRMWDEQVAALAGPTGVTRLDLRGFGRSTLRPDAAWSHAQDVVEVLDTVGLDHVHLVGSSFGAGVAVEVALIHPERVRSLILAPPGGSMLVTMTDDLRTFIDAENAALDAGRLDQAVELNVATWVVGKGRTEADVPAELRDRVRIMQAAAFAAADLVGEPGQPEFEPIDRASEITAPTMIIIGGHDLDTSIDAARHWAARLPNVRRIDWGEAAHLPSLEQPRRFSELVSGWIADNP